MKRLEGSHIVLGVTGSISAYKACMILRMLQKEGAEVRVVATENALKFVSPLTFETLSGAEVVHEMFPEHKTVKTRHISLAEWADAVLIAPATANCIGKIASGIADDFLTTLVIASRSPVIFAPAMDYQMVQNVVYLDNCDKLATMGYHFIPTEEGPLASGATGPGRLARYESIMHKVTAVIENRPSLMNKTIIISAGPTIEPIDPVRFISNKSTGKMGFALAEAAAMRGADVTLITGPSNLEAPYTVRRIDVLTAEEMKKEVLNRCSDADVLIMAAAVSDFRPKNVNMQKIKKSGGMELVMEKTDDILEEVSRAKRPRVVVGFSMETEDGPARAMKKLEKKSLDMICLNNLNEEGAGFGTDTNRITLFMKNGTQEKLPLLSKFEAARKILESIEEWL